MSGQKLDDPSVMELTSKVLIATIVALFLVLVLVFCFHLYAKWLWHRRRQSLNNHHRQQHSSSGGVTVLRRGLDPSFLKTIPIIIYNSNSNYKDGLECAVCLSELQEGEETRILPKCNHAFHAECIDMWFHSHSTCPICRNPVSDSDQTTDKISVESLLDHHHQTQEQSRPMNGGGGDFPTNMLFWGDETQVSTLTSQLEETQHHQLLHNNNNNNTHVEASSSSSSETNNKPDLAIDIPAASSQVTSEDEKTPVLSRMQSLRRILSTSTRFNPFSP